MRSATSAAVSMFKSSTFPSTFELTFGNIILDRVFSQLGIYKKDSGKEVVLKTLETLEKFKLEWNNDAEFKIFLEQKFTGRTKNFPQQMLDKLRKYCQYRFIDECKTLSVKYSNNKIDLYNYLKGIERLIHKYNKLYERYNSKTIYTGRYETPETVSGQDALFRQSAHDFMDCGIAALLTHLPEILQEQSRIVEQINELINEYSSKSKKAHDVYDEKIYLLKLAKKTVSGDYFSTSTPHVIEGSSKIYHIYSELFSAIHLYQDAFQGERTKNIIEQSLKFANKNRLPQCRRIISNSGIANNIKMDDGDRQFERIRPIFDVVKEIQTLSSNINVANIFYTRNPTDIINYENVGKFNCTDGKIYFNVENNGGKNFMQIINVLQDEYDGKKTTSEMHEHKLNIVNALHEFLIAPIEHTSLQKLMLSVQQNHMGFTGRNSKTKKLFVDILQFAEIDKVVVVPQISKNKIRNELNILAQKIDLCAHSASSHVNNLFAKINTTCSNLLEVDKENIGKAQLQLNELMRKNNQKERNELTPLEKGEFAKSEYSQSNKIVNKVVSCRQEILVQINEEKKSLEEIDFTDKLKNLTNIANIANAELEKFLVAMKYLGQKCMTCHNGDCSIAELQEIRIELERIYRQSSILFQDYFDVVDEAKSSDFAAKMENRLKELAKIVNLNYTDEQFNTIYEQSKIREQKELEEKYVKIDEKYEQLKKEDAKFYNMYNKLNEKYGITEEIYQYNDIEELLKDAENTIAKTNQYFTALFGGLSKISNSKENDKTLEIELAELSKQNPNEIKIIINNDDSDEKMDEKMDKISDQIKLNIKRDSAISSINIHAEKNKIKISEKNNIQVPTKTKKSPIKLQNN